MKTFQKLLTNSLLFAENRLCRKEGAKEQGQQSAAPEEQEKFEIGQIVEGYGLTKEDNVTVEKIEKVQGYDKVTLSDKTVIERVKFEFDKDGKKEPTWLTCRKLNTGTYVDKQGEQPLEFVPSRKDLMPESEAIKQLEEKANEAKKKLEEAKKKALEGVSEPNKEQATQAIEEKYKKAAEKIDKLLSEAKTKIEEEKNDEGNVIKGIAEELAKTFDVDAEKASEEGEKEMGFEAEFKGKLKNPEDLHKWLKSPENRERMRKIVLVGNVGAKKYTVDFGKLKTALNLDDNEYEIAERNLRIGNLLEDDVIRKITSVKTKGKEMVAKYFYQGGEKVKGIYTEKNKYIPIWDGTEISLEPGKESALEEVKGGDKDSEKKVTKAKTAAPAGGETPATAEAPAAEPAPGTPEAAAKAKAETAAATSPESRTAQGLDSTPVKPLEPTESKDVAGAKTFNGITYKPNGANFDIIDSSAKVTNTVDATALAVLEGREIPTEAWMKKTIETKFPYLQGDAKFTLVENENDPGFKKIEAVYGNDSDGLKIEYGLKGNTKKITVKGKIDQFLKDTAPGTIAQFYFDADTIDIKTNLEEETKDELAKKLLDRDWAGALEALSDQDSPDPTVLALVMASITMDDFNGVNADKITALKGKISAKTIAEKWAEKYKANYLTGETIQILEKFNNGPLDEETLDEIMKCPFGDKEKLPVYEKYKSNQKVVKWCMEEYQDSILDGGTSSITKEQFLTILNGYKGETLIGDIAGVVAAYPKIDDLTDLKDDEKAALKTKCKEIFTKYLEANADKEGAYDYKETFETRYGAGFKFEEGSLPPANIFARYLEKTSQTILTAGALDGTATLTPNNKEYISAFLTLTKQAPAVIDAEKESRTELIKNIYAEASATNTPIAKIWQSALSEYLASTGDMQEGDRGTIFLSLYNSAKSGSLQPEEQIKVLEALDKYPPDEQTRITGAKTADKFSAWYNKELTKAYFASGQFDKLDPENLDDPAQKEFIKAYEKPSEATVEQVRRLITSPQIKQEHLKKLKEQGGSWIVSLEINFALGLKGEAKKDTEEMNTPDKYYYLAKLEQDPQKRKELLTTAVNDKDFGSLSKEMQVEIFEAMKKEHLAPDMFVALETLAATPITDGTSDLDKKSILRARLLRASLETAECLPPDQIADIDLKEGISIDAKDLPGNAQAAELNCDPDKLVTAVDDYVKDGGDIEVAKGLYNVYHEKGTRDWKTELSNENQKKYASLMSKLSNKTNDKKYISDIDASLMEGADAVAAFESKGKFLDAAKAIDISDEKNIPKKKELLRQALETEKADKALVAAEYAALDDQESKETAVDIYLEAGKYEEAKDLMLKLGDESIGFIKSKLDDLVNNKQADLAADICKERKMYVDLVKTVYMNFEKSKDLKINLTALITASTGDEALNDALVDLVLLKDDRKKENFDITNFDAARLVRRNLDKFRRDDDTKNAVKTKLGKEIFDNLDGMQNAHTYTLNTENKTITVEEMNGIEVSITYEIPEGVSPGVRNLLDGREWVDFVNGKNERISWFQIDQGGNQTGVVEEGFKDQYELDLSQTGKVILKEKSPEPKVGRPTEQEAKQPDQAQAAKPEVVRKTAKNSPELTSKATIKAINDGIKKENSGIEVAMVDEKTLDIGLNTGTIGSVKTENGYVKVEMIKGADPDGTIEDIVDRNLVSAGLKLA